MAKKQDKKIPDVKVVCRNKRARHEYRIENTVEAGMVLLGSEVKSLRDGRGDLADAYGAFDQGEIYLVGAHIGIYEKASHFNHEPRRRRKLLLHKRTILKFGIKIRERGYTLVPLQIYFKQGRAKVLLGLAKGRKQYDNRDLIRQKVERREMRESTRHRMSP